MFNLPSFSADIPKAVGATANPASARARHLDRALSSSPTAHDSRITPAEDERQTSALYLQSFAPKSFIVPGKIVFAAPFANWYRVLLDTGGKPISCCALSDTSFHPFSIRGTSPLSTDSPVLVYVDPNCLHGFILGCIPPKTTDESANHSDCISQGSGGGFRRERYYRQIPELFEDNGNLIDFSANRPSDSLAIGEWGRFSTLGGGIFIDPLMSFLRIDEMCGMWLFYMDRLLRICAHNYDFRSVASEEYIRDDSSEACFYYGFTPYRWEAFGVVQPDQAAHKLNDNKAVQYSEPYGRSEPLQEDQQPIYRTEEFRGYLGQGYMRHVLLPQAEGSKINRASDGIKSIGVFREHVGLDGSWAVESAHSISLVKRALIAIPRRKKQPEDPTGDDLQGTENPYRFAGQHGEGPEHKIRSQLPLGEGEHPHVLAAAALTDTIAYDSNWKALHAFHYHTGDFELAQPDAPELFEKAQQPINFSALASSQWLDPPEPVQIHVDHRYQETAYYETVAGLFVLPDGSVLIRDGYGSEIRMTGGSIQQSAPGDVLLQPGKNLTVYGGDDIILKARNSIDISATSHDVRIKAERHLECLAGNGGKVGRLLLECQASGPMHRVAYKYGEDVTQTGIILKAKDSELLGLASSIYLRTGVGGSGGEIVLDAESGRRGLRVVAQQAVFHTAAGVDIAIPVNNPRTVYHFGPNTCLVPNSLQVGSGLRIRSGGLVLSGNLNGIGCSISSDGNTDGKVRDLNRSPAAMQATSAALSAVGAAFAARSQAMATAFREQVTARWYVKERPGNKDVLARTQFAPRNAAQMNTTKFLLPETYWQQLRRASSGGTVWKENVIKYQSVEMMPHPGKAAWADQKSFRRVDLQLHSLAEGKDFARGEKYESPTPPTWSEVELDNNYPVNAPA